MRAAALERLIVRRAKCRLLCRDAGQAVIVAKELEGMRRLTGTSAVDLYNAACLFAVATANPHLPRDERLVDASVAWQTDRHLTRPRPDQSGM